MSNDSVRRIMAEVKEFNVLNKSPTTFYYAAPLESDLFEWHFTVRGPPDTPFADGVYHGRIVLPAEYPLKPPEIILLTQNGRFEVGKRICLSVTAHHQETWQPSWGIRTILTALVGFMPSKAEGVGALDYPDDDRRRLARRSWHFSCDRCAARPVQQLVVPAAVAAQFPGAASLPDVSERPSAAPVMSLATDEGDEGEPCSAAGTAGAAASASSSRDVPPGDAGSGPVGGDRGVSLEGSPSAASEVRELAPRMENSLTNVASAASSTDTSTAGVEITARTATATVTEAEAQTEADEITADQPRADATMQQSVQEPELLYLAYAIVAVIVAVVVRRIVILTLQ